MGNQYRINSVGFLMHPKMDRLNGYRTIVYNHLNDTFHLVNRFGYEVLAAIDSHPAISLAQLCEVIAYKLKKIPWQIEHKVKKFVDQMENESVVEVIK